MNKNNINQRIHYKRYTSISHKVLHLLAIRQYVAHGTEKFMPSSKPKVAFFYR